MKHNGKEIQIHYMPFPEGCENVGGGVMERSNNYLILINSLRPQLLQRRSLGHELAHVYLDHFDTSKPIVEVEREARQKAWHYYRAYRDNRL